MTVLSVPTLPVLHPHVGPCLQAFLLWRAAVATFSPVFGDSSRYLGRSSGTGRVRGSLRR
jgi:hypothetical protein